MSTAFAAPSLQITSGPVVNNGWTGPAIDPNASAGQWFVDEASREIREVRTHEFYDNVYPNYGGGNKSYFAIEGYAQNIQYSAVAGNIIAFDIVATITNDTPTLSGWRTGSNSHVEVLSTPDQYRGTLLAPKLTAEFAIADLTTRPSNFSDPYRQGDLPHIIARNEDELAWYCYTPNNPLQQGWGNFYVPTWDFQDIPVGGSATRILKFVVDGSGLTSTDPRYAAFSLLAYWKMKFRYDRICSGC